MEILGTEQKYALSKFKKGENLFVTGPGGTGKTLLIKHMVKHMHCDDDMKKKYQVCAMTGCAAILLQCGARTLHSWSGIKLARGEIPQILAGLLRNKSAVQTWKKTKILILDEVSMLSKKLFELIELTARRIRGSSLPFGGMQVVFTGDFYQLPPVPTMGEPDTEAFCFESPKWLEVFPYANHIQLTTMFRQKDPVYINILSQIRVGELDEENKQLMKTYIKREFDAEANHGVIPTKLFAIRSKADYVNKAMFSKINEPEYIYEIIKLTDCTTILDKDKDKETELKLEDLRNGYQLSDEEKEYEINQLIMNSNLSTTLSLKIGALVMCTHNIEMDRGICNGSQGIIVDIIEGSSSSIPVVLFSNGARKSIDIHYIQSEIYPTIAVGQIPLCLAWALTIHKIQGATLEMADMDLGNTIFEYGQTYVALSRIKSLFGLYLSAFHPHRIKANPKVKHFYSQIPEINIDIRTLEEEEEKEREEARKKRIKKQQEKQQREQIEREQMEKIMNLKVPPSMLVSLRSKPSSNKNTSNKNKNEQMSKMEEDFSDMDIKKVSCFDSFRYEPEISSSSSSDSTIKRIHL